MSLKIGTLAWVIGKVLPELSGKVAEVIGPLIMRKPRDCPAAIPCYLVVIEGKAWCAKPKHLLPFSDPDIERVEYFALTKEGGLHARVG